jgi:hypothetical protein
MDPLGFALENFDSIGYWRPLSEAGTAIDSSAQMPDGTKFSGPDGLRRVLMDRKERFVLTLTEKLMSYALGRALQVSDYPSVRAIVRGAEPQNYRWSSIVLGIARSPQFTMRTTAGAPAGKATTESQ